MDIVTENETNKIRIEFTYLKYFCPKIMILYDTFIFDIEWESRLPIILVLMELNFKQNGIITRLDIVGWKRTQTDRWTKESFLFSEMHFYSFNFGLDWLNCLWIVTKSNSVRLSFNAISEFSFSFRKILKWTQHVSL